MYYSIKKSCFPRGWQLCLFMWVLSFGFISAKPVIEFDKYSYDFGYIDTKTDSVNCLFEFKNTGDEILIIDSIKTSCQCTNYTLSKKKLTSAQSGEIELCYHINHNLGNFKEIVKIYTNTDKKLVKLKISGRFNPTAVDSKEKTELVEHGFIKAPIVRVLLEKYESRNDFIIIDLRSKQDYLKGTISNSVNLNIPVSSFLDSLHKYGKNNIFLLFCDYGIKSKRYYNEMRNNGFERVYHLKGGFYNWKEYLFRYYNRLK